MGVGAIRTISKSSCILSTPRPTPTPKSTIIPQPLKHEVTSYFAYLNPDYDFPFDDIALAKLGAFSKYPPLRIQTPALAALSESGEPVTIAGWGCTDGDPPGPTSLYLRWAEVTIEPDSACAGYGGVFDPATMVGEQACSHTKNRPSP